MKLVDKLNNTITSNFPKHDKNEVQTKSIKKSEPITAIVFSILFLLFLTFSNHLIGLPIVGNNEMIIIVPFINRDTFMRFLPLLFFLIGLGIIKEVLKLLTGGWTNKLALLNFLINAMSVLFVSVVVLSPSFWNPNFIAQLIETGSINPQGEVISSVSSLWNSNSLIVLLPLSIGFVVDSIVGFYKVKKS